MHSEVCCPGEGSKANHRCCKPDATTVTSVEGSQNPTQHLYSSNKSRLRLRLASFVRVSAWHSQLGSHMQDKNSSPNLGSSATEISKPFSWLSTRKHLCWEGKLENRGQFYTMQNPPSNRNPVPPAGCANDVKIGYWIVRAIRFAFSSCFGFGVQFQHSN